MNRAGKIDAGSGVCRHHFVITEPSYYQVRSSVSRAMGVCAQSVIARAMGMQLIRPKSSNTEWLKDKVGA